MTTFRTAMTVVFFLATTRVGTAVDITSCGATVPDTEVGILQTDVSCIGAFIGVTLGNAATLNLNGHSLTGGFNDGVRCLGRRCTVIGPGTIASSSVADGINGIEAGASARVTVHGLRVTGFTNGVLRGGRGKTVATDAMFDHNIVGIMGDVKATNVDASNNMTGGIAAGRKASGSNVVTSGNGAFGIEVVGGSVRMSNLVADDNGTVGIYAQKVRLRDSDVTGNNGFALGIDVASASKPGLRNTTCGKSHQLLASIIPTPWGVCSQD
jgi:hypothetical protein